MNSTRPDISERNFRIIGVAILVLALILRLIGARGDLGQDEILSLSTVAKVKRIDRIFWAVNFDNNHPLNSAWLYIVGAHASYLVLRAFSIALGLGTVVAAGIWGARRSRVTGLIGMLLMATSYFMVNYQSEARGYAGLVLCMLLASMALESILEGKDRRLPLAFALLGGFLFHPYVIFAGAAMAVTCLWIVWKRERSLQGAAEFTLRTFTWSLIMGAIAVSPILLLSYTVGDVLPFHWPVFLATYGDAAGFSVALPELHRSYVYAGISVVLAIGLFVKKPEDFRATLYLCMLVVVPGVLSLGHLPNLTYPRHLTMVALAFFLICADLLGWAWALNAKARLAAAIVVLAVVVGNGLNLQKFYASTRGHYEQAVLAMTANGPATYAVSMGHLTNMVDYYAARNNRTATYPPLSEWCTTPPDWYLMDRVVPAATPKEIVIGPKECRITYARPADYPVWGLTGLEWLLYRRQ